MRILAGVAASASLLFAMSCGSAPEPGRERSGAVVPSNVHQAAPGVFSGPMPGGDVSFSDLGALGVRSLISVDGARPAVEEAAARGMRYAHVPIGYDGVSEDAIAELARAMRDMERPVYVHCHHGKHRGPAAAAAGMIALGEIEVDDGLRLLKASGTSPSYPGLWASVGACARLSDEEIDAAPVAPPIAPVGGFVEGMAAIDRAWDHLKLCRDAGWGTPEDHPDLVPAAEAGMVADVLRRTAADAQISARAPEFHEWLRRTQEESTELERLIVARAGRAEIDGAFEALASSCRRCHEKYRN